MEFSAALKKNSPTDNTISFGVMIFISVPSFVVMTFLVMLFGLFLGLGSIAVSLTDVGGSGIDTILPVLGLSFGAIAGLTRVTRAELTEVLTSEFLLLARTKGLTRKQRQSSVMRCAIPWFRSSRESSDRLLVFCPDRLSLNKFMAFLEPERFFSALWNSTTTTIILILGITAFYTIISLFAVLLVDLSYGVVDPRIRMGARK
ncbi:MAG: ABC transporter permease subunit [Bacillus subtilis]|nr:ABC transporter permease subunit [Bacillus subtilis]